MKGKVCVRMVFLLIGVWGTPMLASAQGGSWADGVKSLHSVLDQLYVEMIPLCSKLIGVGRAIAGFAALWYIAYRVWGHLARAEPIDFYPLFRPFVLGFIVANFMSFIALLNGVLQPVVAGTTQMVTDSEAAVAALLKQKEEAIKKTTVWEMYVGPTGEGDRDKWYKYTHPEEDPDDEGFFESIGNDVRFAFAKAGYNLRNAIKEVIAEILQLLFAAVSLCINTMRTFNLIILAILGPLVIAIATFDGFQYTLKYWIARYINVFLWLPVCNIFGAVIGKIQENMLKIDISQIGQTGDTFFSRTDMGYFIFLIIGIFGYTTVPSIADQIVRVGGADSLTRKATGAAVAAGGMAGGMAGAGAAKAMAGAASIANIDNYTQSSSANRDGGGGYGQSGGSGGYMHDKLSGK